MFFLLALCLSILLFIFLLFLIIAFFLRIFLFALYNLFIFVVETADFINITESTRSEKFYDLVPEIINLSVFPFYISSQYSVRISIQ